MQIEAGRTYNENLPNTIKKKLDKIKEENEENKIGKKTILPLIKNRPKSNYVINSKNIIKENEKHKK